MLFQGGNLVWRGTFEHGADLAAPTAINISVSGGQYFAASAWLNEHYLGASYTSLPTNNESWPVTSDMVREGKNYVTVLQEYVADWSWLRVLMEITVTWGTTWLASLYVVLQEVANVMFSSQKAFRYIPRSNPVASRSSLAPRATT